MKILCLADLHISNNRILNYVFNQISNIKSDIVLIAGDVFESEYANTINPYKQISKFFPDTIVLCVLGNHEFWYYSTKEIIKKYKDQYNPDKYNVHYLDIINYFDFNNYRFVGNFLGYDGTIDVHYNLEPDKFKNWNDNLIKNWKNYRWKRYSKTCQQKIIDNMSMDMDNVLITHTVPHKRLNLHEISPFNIYSGIDNFIDQYNFIFAICGHTHIRSMGLVINNCNCINVGSDYHCLNYELIEI